jgi:hypothetical protein
MFRKAVWIGLVLALSAGVASAGSHKWFHVHVHEGGKGGEEIIINLPIKLVHSLLPMIQSDSLGPGKFHLGMNKADNVSLKQAWAAVCEAEDGEYVTIRDREKSESVRVAKQGDHLVVKVDKKDEHVDIRIRTAVVDAMMAPAGDELDLVAAFDVLSEQEGDIITVQDGDDRVRIWIDDKEVTE